MAGSAYHTALQLNPDLAEQRRTLPKAKHPQLFGWTAEMSLLADIADILYKHATGDGRVTLPRPLNALDHASLAKRQAGMNRLIARFSPQHTHLTPQIAA